MSTSRKCPTPPDALAGAEEAGTSTSAARDRGLAEAASLKIASRAGNDALARSHGAKNCGEKKGHRPTPTVAVSSGLGARNAEKNV